MQVDNKVIMDPSLSLDMRNTIDLNSDDNQSMKTCAYINSKDSMNQVAYKYAEMHPLGNYGLTVAPTIKSQFKDKEHFFENDMPISSIVIPGGSTVFVVLIHPKAIDSTTASTSSNSNMVQNKALGTFLISEEKTLNMILPEISVLVRMARSESSFSLSKIISLPIPLDQKEPRYPNARSIIIMIECLTNTLEKFPTKYNNEKERMPLDDLIKLEIANRNQGNNNVITEESRNKFKEILKRRLELCEEKFKLQKKKLCLFTRAGSYNRVLSNNGTQLLMMEHCTLESIVECICSPAETRMGCADFVENVFLSSYPVFIANKNQRVDMFSSIITYQNAPINDTIYSASADAIALQNTVKDKSALDYLPIGNINSEINTIDKENATRQMILKEEARIRLEHGLNYNKTHSPAETLVNMVMNIILTDSLALSSHEVSLMQQDIYKWQLGAVSFLERWLVYRYPEDAFDVRVAGAILRGIKQLSDMGVEGLNFSSISSIIQRLKRLYVFCREQNAFYILEAERIYQLRRIEAYKKRELKKMKANQSRNKMEMAAINTQASAKSFAISKESADEVAVHTENSEAEDSENKSVLSTSLISDQTNESYLDIMGSMLDDLEVVDEELKPRKPPANLSKTELKEWKIQEKERLKQAKIRYSISKKNEKSQKKVAKQIANTRTSRLGSSKTPISLKTDAKTGQLILDVSSSTQSLKPKLSKKEKEYLDKVTSTQTEDNTTKIDTMVNATNDSIMESNSYIYSEKGGSIYNFDEHMNKTDVLTSTLRTKQEKFLETSNDHTELTDYDFTEFSSQSIDLDKTNQPKTITESSHLQSSYTYSPPTKRNNRKNVSEEKQQKEEEKLKNTITDIIHDQPEIELVNELYIKSPEEGAAIVDANLKFTNEDMSSELTECMPPDETSINNQSVYKKNFSLSKGVSKLGHSMNTSYCVPKATLENLSIPVYKEMIKANKLKKRKLHLEFCANTTRKIIFPNRLSSIMSIIYFPSIKSSIPMSAATTVGKLISETNDKPYILANMHKDGNTWISLYQHGCLDRKLRKLHGIPTDFYSFKHLISSTIDNWVNTLSSSKTSNDPEANKNIKNYLLQKSYNCKFMTAFKALFNTIVITIRGMLLDMDSSEIANATTNNLSDINKTVRKSTGQETKGQTILYAKNFAFNEWVHSEYMRYKANNELRDKKLYKKCFDKIADNKKVYDGDSGIENEGSAEKQETNSITDLVKQTPLNELQEAQQKCDKATEEAASFKIDGPTKLAILLTRYFADAYIQVSPRDILAYYMNNTQTEAIALVLRRHNILSQILTMIIMGIRSYEDAEMLNDASLPSSFDPNDDHSTEKKLREKLTGYDVLTKGQSDRTKICLGLLKVIQRLKEFNCAEGVFCISGILRTPRVERLYSKEFKAVFEAIITGKMGFVPLFPIPNKLAEEEIYSEYSSTLKPYLSKNTTELVTAKYELPTIEEAIIHAAQESRDLIPLLSSEDKKDKIILQQAAADSLAKKYENIPKYIAEITGFDVTKYAGIENNFVDYTKESTEYKKYGIDFVPYFGSMSKECVYASEGTSNTDSETSLINMKKATQIWSIIANYLVYQGYISDIDKQIKVTTNEEVWFKTSSNSRVHFNKIGKLLKAHVFEEHFTLLTEISNMVGAINISLWKISNILKPTGDEN